MIRAGLVFAFIVSFGGVPMTLSRILVVSRGLIMMFTRRIRHSSLLVIGTLTTPRHSRLGRLAFPNESIQRRLIKCTSTEHHRWHKFPIALSTYRYEFARSLSLL